MWWFVSPAIVFGSDALDHLNSIEGKRALIVTDEQMRRLGFVEEVERHLKEVGKQVEVFDRVEPEPSLENVSSGVDIANRSQPDLLVALGGGSCIDAAKAIWILYERPDLRLKEVSALTELKLRKKARLVAIPTTSGTGSDATWVAVITDKAEGLKLDYITSRELVPDISILDPRFCMKMPRGLTAQTGLDALTHGIEAYVTTWHTDFSDALAMRVVQLVFKYLEKAYTNPDNVEAREKMHNAASMAGLAFSNSHLGIAHSMGHTLGAVYKMTHGLSVALSNLYVMQFNRDVVGEKYAEIARGLGITASSTKEAATALISAQKDLMNQLHQPVTLTQSGIDRNRMMLDMKTLIERTNMSACTFVAPRVPSSKELENLYLCALEGREVDF
ncbi:MAG TPA: iron-containing alcohol dehydrogenase [Candidatus Acidoferrales bacterium]|nr:iron-containing alcohol dehydrogenase [Candidatus Acidoferrales bacterium]